MKKREKADDGYLKELGKRIKTIRKEKGIKQVELAYSCDIEKQNMQRIEAGNTNPTVLMLRRIAENLGISLSELLDF
jgi:transcriptional regulator with XRE-family HTH domain